MTGWLIASLVLLDVAEKYESDYVECSSLHDSMPKRNPEITVGQSIPAVSYNIRLRM